MLVPSAQRGQATIGAAFERALRDVNAFMRAMARTRIDLDEMLVRRISVATRDETITTILHTNRPHRFHTRRRHPARVTTETGDGARLTQHFRDGALEMVFDLDEGRRWTVLRVDEAGRLLLTTTIDPTRLDRNVRYELTYRRVQR